MRAEAVDSSYQLLHCKALMDRHKPYSSGRSVESEVPLTYILYILLLSLILSIATQVPVCPSDTFQVQSNWPCLSPLSLHNCFDSFLSNWKARELCIIIPVVHCRLKACSSCGNILVVHGKPCCKAKPGTDTLPCCTIRRWDLLICSFLGISQSESTLLYMSSWLGRNHRVARTDDGRELIEDPFWCCCTCLWNHTNTEYRIYIIW